ncbi:MAG: helix-turn-helix transcriptional regulator [Clostridium chrysemydis]|uniref:helix-turn-helix transcriptional regulator n=1 Tax=Clostridium chrysemydis TaxID=2665504 RepID=UPI003F2AA428
MNKLQNFRNKKHLSRSEISNKLNVSESYYTKIELGLRNPSYNFIMKFKAEFNCSIDDIFFN